MTFIWRENTYGYFSVETICSEERIVWRERHSRKTVSPERQILYEDLQFRAKWRLLCVLSFEQFYFFQSAGLLHGMFNFQCSLAQLHSTNKYISSSATAAKRSFMLNLILNERLYCWGLKASKLGNIALDMYVNIFVIKFGYNARYLTNREAFTVLCSVIKHAGSG